MRKRKAANIADHRPLRDAFAHAAPGMAITDLQGNVININEAFARIVAREREEIGSTNIWELTHPEDRARHNALLEQLLSSQIPGFVIEKRYLRPDGSSVWVRNSVSLIGEEPTSSRHLIAICEDISDRKRAERALEDQDRLALLGRLISTIAHEISNPLEAALNLIFLAQQSSTLEEGKKYLTMAEEELGRASNITAQGLQFHRDSTSPTSADIVELVASVLTLFHGKLEGNGVRAKLKEADAPHLICFPGEIRQVIANLIGNAIDAMPGGGELRVRVRPATDWRTDRKGVRITIADTGLGMSEMTRRHIFEAFFTTKGPDGSGLGLWVTANIVHKHQGSIQVRSRNLPGSSGTVFALTFPYSGADGKAAGMHERVA